MAQRQKGFTRASALGPIADFVEETGFPFRQRVEGGGVEPVDLFVGELGGGLEGGYAGAVQDLVRVGVPDAREKPRIGEKCRGSAITAAEPLSRANAYPLESGVKPQQAGRGSALPAVWLSRPGGRNGRWS